MPLNIKNAEAERLVAELAALTGESKTQAVLTAVRERLLREQRRRDRQALVVELLAIGEKAAAYLTGDPPEPHGELLYDEHGLPR